MGFRGRWCAAGGLWDLGGVVLRLVGCLGDMLRLVGVVYRSCAIGDWWGMGFVLGVVGGVY